MKFLAQRIKKNVQGGNKVHMVRKGAEKDDFAELKAGSKRVEGLFHCFDSHL